MKNLSMLSLIVILLAFISGCGSLGVTNNLKDDPNIKEISIKFRMVATEDYSKVNISEEQFKELGTFLENGAWESQYLSNINRIPLNYKISITYNNPNKEFEYGNPIIGWVNAETKTLFFYNKENQYLLKVTGEDAVNIYKIFTNGESLALHKF